MKYLFIFTWLVHYMIAFTWMYFTGIIGTFLMMAHWSFLGGHCWLTYIEEWIHLRLLGYSYLNLDAGKTLLYKLLN